MTKTVLLFIAASVLLSSLAQIALKAGMNHPAVQQAIHAASGLWVVRQIALNPLVVLGLVLYFASAAVWLLVLARIDVSLAYPFVGVGFIVTMLLAWLIHDEPLSLGKLLGTTLIACGVVVLART